MTVLEKVISILIPFLILITSIKYMLLITGRSREIRRIVGQKIKESKRGNQNDN